MKFCGGGGLNLRLALNINLVIKYKLGSVR